MAKDLKTFFARINNLIENNKLQKLRASENGFGEEANFYLMSFDNPLATDLIGSLRKIINQNI
jgi:hypothetical protein